MPGYKPYKNESFNTIYNLLFCDDLELFQSQNKNQDAYPWNILFASNSSEKDLNKIIDDVRRTNRAIYRAIKFIHNLHVVYTRGCKLRPLSPLSNIEKADPWS